MWGIVKDPDETSFIIFVRGTTRKNQETFHDVYDRSIDRDIAHSWCARPITRHLLLSRLWTLTCYTGCIVYCTTSPSQQIITTSCEVWCTPCCYILLFYVYRHEGSYDSMLLCDTYSGQCTPKAREYRSEPGSLYPQSEAWWQAAAAGISSFLSCALFVVLPNQPSTLWRRARFGLCLPVGFLHLRLWHHTISGSRRWCYCFLVWSRYTTSRYWGYNRWGDRAILSTMDVASIQYSLRWWIVARLLQDDYWCLWLSCSYQSTHFCCSLVVAVLSY